MKFLLFTIAFLLCFNLSNAQIVAKYRLIAEANYSYTGAGANAQKYIDDSTSLKYDDSIGYNNILKDWDYNEKTKIVYYPFTGIEDYWIVNSVVRDTIGSTVVSNNVERSKSVLVSNWDTLWKYRDTISANKRKSNYIYGYSNGIWLNVRRADYQYNGNGLQDDVIRYKFNNSTAKWELNKRELYTYNNQNPDTTYELSWNANVGSWDTVTMLLYIYGGNPALLIDEQVYKKSGTSGWQKYLRFTYTYNGKYVVDTMFNYEADNNGNWEEKSRTTYNINVDNRVYMEEEMIPGNGGQYQPSTKIEYEYDANGNMKGKMVYIWFISGGVYNIAHAHYYYYEKFYQEDNTTSITNISSLPGVIVYPIPAVESINIKTPDHITIHQYILLNDIGQVVVKGRGPVEKINVSRLNIGTYYLKLQTREGVVIYPVQILR